MNLLLLTLALYGQIDGQDLRTKETDSIGALAKFCRLTLTGKDEQKKLDYAVKVLDLQEKRTVNLATGEKHLDLTGKIRIVVGKQDGETVMYTGDVKLVGTGGTMIMLRLSLPKKYIGMKASRNFPLYEGFVVRWDEDVAYAEAARKWSVCSIEGHEGSIVWTTAEFGRLTLNVPQLRTRETHAIGESAGIRQDD